MERKYEFVEGDTITIAPGRTVKRIRALVAIAALGVVPGDLGGYIESESNLEVAQVYGNAWVYGNARVYGDAQVYGNARVYGDAWVSGDASKTPLQIGGLTWSVTVADTSMVIGCQDHSIDAWWSFDDSAISNMDSHALEFWRTYKPLIFGLICADGRFQLPLEA